MIKTKAAVIIMIAPLAFTGCGTEIRQNDVSVPDILVENLEVHTKDSTLLETNRPTVTTSIVTTSVVTTSTTQKTTTSTSTTSTVSITSTTNTTKAQTMESELITEPIETESVVEVVEPWVKGYDTEESESYDAPQESAHGDLIRIDMRGTYYAPGSWNQYSATGGSGHALIDCNYGGDGYAKGSIASGYLYNLLGYYANGGRTTVWLCVDGYPEMSGLYYLDDSSGADVIDFFYSSNSNCQFSQAGVVSVDVYYAN